ncbi:MAG: hypothetical protein K0Q55_1232, partial [Verrucomicrobia bacterium]|nr:hypothetical protein [Verrucomicrobiota bacterium]
MQNDVCYWCGGPSSSKEHVPPRGLFPPGKRNDLITVPACDAHNKDTSKLDEKFRFYFQACADSPVAMKDFEERTIKGLRRKESQGFAKGLAKDSFHITLPNGEKTIVLKVSPAEQDAFFEKLVKGIYYSLFRKPLTGKVGTFSTIFINPGFEYEPLVRILRPHISNPDTMTVFPCKNPEVFQFKYA